MLNNFDRRIWIPDATCNPFNLEFGIVAADLLMGRFTVPRGNVGVIAHVTTQTDVVARKSIQRVIIQRGRPDPADVSQAITLHGALTSVEELDSTGVGLTGVNSLGFVIGTGPNSRPCRVILEAGEYQVVKVSTTGLGNVTFHGWTFNEK